MKPVDPPYDIDRVCHWPGIIIGLDLSIGHLQPQHATIVALEGVIDQPCPLGATTSHTHQVRYVGWPDGPREVRLVQAAIGGDMSAAAVLANELAADVRMKLEEPCLSVESPRRLHRDEP